MARREGSPGYRTPSLDPLECRILLSSLHGSNAASRTAPTLAADVARLAAAAASKSTIGIARDVAVAPHPNGSPEVDENVAGTDNVDTRAVYIAERPTASDPNLLLLTGPNQAAGAPMEPGAGHLAIPAASNEVPRLAPTIGAAPSNPAGAGDDIDRETAVALDTSRALFLTRIPAASLGRIQVVTPADSSPGDGAPPASASRRSDLLSDFLPFDRGSLEDAFDRFFDQLDDLDDGATGPDDPARAIPDSLLVAAAVGALVLGRRYWRRGEGGDEAGWGATPGEGEGADDDDVRFPGRPGSWPTRCL